MTVRVTGRKSSVPRTQAEWDAKRAEVKAEAAEVVKANAEEALEAKKAFQNRNKVEGIDTITEPGEVQSNPDASVPATVTPANATQTHEAERYPAPVTPVVEGDKSNEDDNQGESDDSGKSNEE